MLDLAMQSPVRLHTCPVGIPTLTVMMVATDFHRTSPSSKAFAPEPDRERYSVAFIVARFFIKVKGVTFFLQQCLAMGAFFLYNKRKRTWRMEI